MAIISDTNLEILLNHLNDSYAALSTGFGAIDQSDSGLSEINKAKVFVRGGADVEDGVKATSISSTGTVYDLYPFSHDTDNLTIQSGSFYLEGVEHSIDRNTVYDFGTILNAIWWYGAGIDSGSITTIAGATGWANIDSADQRAKALVYISNEPVDTSFNPGSEDMASGEVYDTTHADFALDGTTDYIAAPFLAPTANTYLDKVQLYVSVTGSPNTGLYAYVVDDAVTLPDMTAIIATSFKVSSSDIPSGGGWIDFIFNNPTVLTGGANYWLVLGIGTPEGGAASVIDGTNLYSWHYDDGTVCNDAGDDALAFSDNAGVAWTKTINAVDSDYLAACRFISLLKVRYSGVMSMWQSGKASSLVGTGNAPALAANKNYLAVEAPSSPYVKICECDLFSAYNADSTAVAVAAWGTAATNSILTDVREIVGYVGLEDDDQVEDLFGGVNTTEDSLLVASADATTSAVAGYFSATSNALSTHVTSLASGYTFKTYLASIDLYPGRDFRRFWKVNKSEELKAAFGTFTNDATPAAFPDATYVSADTWCADLSTGVDLELYLPVDEGACTGDIDINVMAIRNLYTTLDNHVDAGVDRITIASHASFTGTIYIFIVRSLSDFTSSELLKGTVSGNRIVLAAETAVCGATVNYEHQAGERVYIVEKIAQAVPSGAAEGTTYNLTQTGKKYIGTAFVQGESGGDAGTNGDVFVVRNR